MTNRRRPAELEILEGTWDTRGTVLGDGTSFVAKDDYEWMEGGHFLLHRVEASIGDAEIRTLEVIGTSPDGDGYVSRSYDSTGATATYRSRLDGGKWEIDGDSERFRGKFSADGRALAGRWSQRHGDDWVPWMDIVLSKRR
jgi:hypothetical protein